MAKPFSCRENEVIKIGDRLPDISFKVMKGDHPHDYSVAELFKNKRVLLVAVPGAFTPTCHRNHLPGYLTHADEILKKSIDKIYVTGVNDVYVMDAWREASKAGNKITFLADGSADFAKAVGLTLDASAHGLGLRSLRYAMIVDDGVVEQLLVEDVPSKADISGAENVLRIL
jgi:peroxiredoxin